MAQVKHREVVEGEWMEHPDLSRVDEIGWTDLMTGGGVARVRAWTGSKSTGNG